MAEPRDPDTEDRRPDHDRPDERDDRDDVAVEEEADLTSADRWIDDDGDLIDFDLDDLRGMEGPDA
jgi:hypothetical protein